MKLFTDLKWGTRDPVAFKDSQLGLVRLRAYGNYTLQIIQPLLFINGLSGTLGTFDTHNITDYLDQLIVSRFNDYLGEKLDSLFNLPGQYQVFAEGLKERLQDDFGKFGLRLTQLIIGAITPPPEVQKAIDDKSKLGLFNDLDALAKMKGAMAIQDAANNPGTAGMGVGLMMPAMLSQYFENKQQKPSSQQCPDCGTTVNADAQFCTQCGHQFVVFVKCSECGRNLPAYAKFCLRCGAKVGQDAKKKCVKCGFVNLAHSVFCNQCGEKLE
jgi:membrane protease subunit (stomatin/prohibitin family)